jgi:hypothetical protein
VSRTAPTDPPLVEAMTRRHLTRPDLPAGSDRITVCATPNGVSSYIAGSAGSPISEVRQEDGALIVRSHHDVFGELYAVLGGPTVLEVALHDTAEQRDGYRAALAEVDAENREQALAAVQAMALAMLRELGIELAGEEASEQVSRPSGEEAPGA